LRTNVFALLYNKAKIFSSNLFIFYQTTICKFIVKKLLYTANGSDFIEFTEITLYILIKKYQQRVRPAVIVLRGGWEMYFKFSTIPVQLFKIPVPK